jgi:hypothetical protein
VTSARTNYRAVPHAVVEANQPQHVLCTLRRLFTVAMHVQRRFNVFLRRKRGDQVERLEDDADLVVADTRQLRLAQLGDVHAVNDDLPRCRGVQPGDDAQQRRFARSGRPRERDPRAAQHVERDAVEDRNLLAAQWQRAPNAVGLHHERRGVESVVSHVLFLLVA